MADLKCFWITQGDLPLFAAVASLEVAMKKTLVFAGAMLALTASFASAADIKLAFDNCAGSGGVATKNFACNANSGIPFSVIGSFIPPAGINEFLGISSQVDISSPSGNLPDWWKHGTGQCRTTSGLGVSFNFNSGPFGCTDFYAGQAAGGFQYDVGFGSPGRARLRLQCAVPIDNRGPIDSSTEYYGFNLQLLLSKSTGTGSCAGCEAPMCIVLNDIQLFQPPEAANDPQLITTSNQNFVTWQSPVVAGCPLSTPTHNSSWGQVKSLYR
jgi:hypothetical protein